MNKNQILGIIYVSVIVLCWGTIGSLVDYPLLKKDIYLAGSIGQYITFSSIGLLSTILGINLFPSFSKKFSDDT